MPAPFGLHPSQIDHGQLQLFLEKQNVDPGRRGQLINDFTDAIDRYTTDRERDHTRLTLRLENVRAAAQTLVEAMPKLGSKEYVWLLNAMIPPVTPITNERLRGFYDLPVTLEMIRAVADGALAKLKSRQGRPVGAPGAFADRLARAWLRGTGQIPRISGATTFDMPRGAFAKFVKIAICALPDGIEFEAGFGDLLRSAVKRVAKQPRKT
jgi:hypothetical protein